MTVQWVAVAIIVPLCTLYAAWNLMGTAGRRRVVAWLARLPWPAAWSRRLAQADTAASACGCDGCDKPAAAAAEPPTQSIVRVHRRHP
jgi:hypothetical protein